MIDKELIKECVCLIDKQLQSLWGGDICSPAITQSVEQALELTARNYSKMSSSHFFKDNKMVFSPYFSVTWMIFLYRVCRQLFLNGYCHEADLVYYLNKVMHSVDWFYQVELPVHFMAEHPLSSVLGKAKYDDYLFVYQGTTIGGNRKNGQLYYPSIGRNIVLYANATVLGDTHIGNNVIISANTYLINETIPDNCVVFGSSPNVIIKKKNEQEIKDMTSHIWKW